MNEEQFNVEDLEEVTTQKEFDGVKLHQQKMYRFNRSGMRYYFDEAGQIYPSVTSIINAVHTDKYVLMELIDKFGGKDGYNQFMKERATYGTILHICAERYLMSGKQGERSISSEQIANVISNQTANNEIDPKVSKWWLKDIKQDLTCIVKFLNEYEVKPLAIEYIGTGKYNNFGYSGAIDLICLMNIKEKGFWGECYKTGARKGEPKETVRVTTVPAIIDFKSGKNGFYYSHEMQLQMYKRMLTDFEYEIDGEYKQVNFDEIKLFNVSPSPRGTTYKIKDQTEAISDAEVSATITLFDKKYYNPPIEIPVVANPITDEAQVINVPVADYLKELIVKKNLTRLTA